MPEERPPVVEFRPRRFRRYPEYKDSGVEWLSEIPAHWGTTRVADQSTLINGYPFDSALFTLDEGMPLVRIRDLHTTDTAVRFAGDPVAAARITTGDILIGMDGDFDVARWQGDDALLNQRMCCLRPRQSISGQFMYHCLPFPLRTINDLTHSTTVKHLSSFDVKKVQLPCPPEEEQAVVASFIDHETGKIDALVAKKEQLIELLQEKRTALITRAVTRGLDPNVPMKDSGVDWLNEIPSHWETPSLGHVTVSRCDGPFGSGLKSEHYSDSGIRVIRLQNIGWADFINLDAAYLDKAYARRLGDHSVKGVDILIAGLGDDGHPVGRACVAPVEIEPAMVKADCFRFRLDRQRVLPRYAAFQLSATASAVSGYHATGATRTRMNLTTTARRKIALPPLEEQRAIAIFLGYETAKVDTLVAKVRQAIDHLKEYRTALISAAVTGKIDVRDDAA